MTQAPQPQRLSASTLSPWRRDRLGAAMFALLALALFAVLARSFTARDLHTQLIAVVACLGAGAGAWWLSSGRRAGAELLAYLGGGAATTGLCVWEGRIGLAVLAGLVTAAGCMLGVHRLRRLDERAVILETLAANLAQLGRDPRPPHRVLDRPRWKGLTLTSVRWRVSAAQPLSGVDEKRSPARVVAGTLGDGYTLEKNRAGMLIAYRPEQIEKNVDTTPSDVRRLTVNLSNTIGAGTRIDDVTRDDEGNIEAFAIVWPEELNGKIAAAHARRRVQNEIVSLLGRPIEMRWMSERDRAEVTPKKSLPGTLPHPGRKGRRDNIVRIGLGRSGDVVWDLNVPNPHMLIAGGTGGGKSSTERTVVAELPTDSELVLIDPKRIELKAFEKLPNAITRARDPREMWDAIEEAHAEMFRRYDLADREGESMLASKPRRFVLIDEGKQLYDMLKRYWNEELKPEMAEAAKSGDGPKPPNGTEPPVWGKLNEILQLGRTARMHVIMCTQQPSGYWMGTDARGNYGVRIACGVIEKESSDMVFGSRIATSMPGGPVEGRAWIVAGKGETPELAQVYWTPKFDDTLTADDAAILDAIGLHDASNDATEHEGPTPAQLPPAKAAENAVERDADGDLDDQRPAAGSLGFADDADDELYYMPPASPAPSAPSPVDDADDELHVSPTPQPTRPALRLVKSRESEAGAQDQPDPEPERETTVETHRSELSSVVSLDRDSEGEDEDEGVREPAPAASAQHEPDDLDPNAFEPVDPWSLTTGQLVMLDDESGTFAARVVEVDWDALDDALIALTVTRDGEEQVMSIEADEKVSASMSG